MATLPIILALFAVILLIKSIKVVPQQNAYVVQRLGKFQEVLQPGINFIIPFIDSIAYKHSLKEMAMDIPEQICITKDNVQVGVDGVVFIQVVDARQASYGIANYKFAVGQLAQTTMRSEIGKIDLDKTFEERTNINSQVVASIDEASIGWGVKTLRYEIKNITPPKTVLMAMEKQMQAEREKRAVILQSEGEKAFCAGASFDELVSINDLETGLQFFSGFAKVINACRKSKKLIIGRVQGRAVGGGVGLASATDYCFATARAEVKLSELAVGIGPFVVGPAVERKIGLSAMSELAINATEWRSAKWAQEKGLFTEVYDSIEEMDSAIASLSSKLALSNPEAMSELKEIFWQGTEHWDELLFSRAAISGRLVLSDFTRSAISAFKAK
jgi:methylglutaconyl-CoA hydratase